MTIMPFRPVIGLRLYIGRRDLERYSDELVADARAVQWDAELQAGLYWPRRGTGQAPWVPQQWTAWLLMEKAGLPLDLIAHLTDADPRHIRKRLLAAWALMLFPPYAARIEQLSRHVRCFGAPHLPSLRPAKEASCVMPTA
jgi:hypothetical protein